MESPVPAEPLTGDTLVTREAPEPLDPLDRFDVREPPRPTVRVETPAVHLPEAAEARYDAPPGTEAERWESKGLFNGFNPRMAGKVVSGPQMDQATAEQYGRVAAVLHHAQKERKIKTVMVTSAMAGEGKTLTALNLALTLSESYGRRVAFIDADLRCSRVHELLNVVRVKGLSEALQDGGQVHARLLAISPRLSVLLAGCSNLEPSGALTSPRMAQVLAEAAASFDWVIVDTPPVVLLPDTNLLARMVDGAIVVIRAGTDLLRRRGARCPDSRSQASPGRRPQRRPGCRSPPVSLLGSRYPLSDASICLASSAPVKSGASVNACWNALRARVDSPDFR